MHRLQEQQESFQSAFERQGARTSGHAAHLLAAIFEIIRTDVLFCIQNWSCECISEYYYTVAGKSAPDFSYSNKIQLLSIVDRK